jgi:hypothetical protein
MWKTRSKPWLRQSNSPFFQLLRYHPRSLEHFPQRGRATTEVYAAFHQEELYRIVFRNFTALQEML